MADGATGIYSEQAVSVPAADDDVLGTDLVVGNGITMIAVQLRPSSASVLSIIRNGVVNKLSSAASIGAGVAFAFTFLVNPGDTINFQAVSWVTGMTIDIDVQGVESGVR